MPQSNGPPAPVRICEKHYEVCEKDYCAHNLVLLNVYRYFSSFRASTSRTGVHRMPG